jgi:hypothetical protein
MKHLFTLLLFAFSLQLSAQTVSSLPSGTVPYGNVFLDTGGNVWAGATGKTFKKLGLKTDVVWLSDSIADLRTSINGKADKSTILNINGVAQDISTSRTWTIPTVTALSALTDVYLSTLSNNQLLKWDSDSSKWTNSAVTIPNSGRLLSDAGLTDKRIPFYNGTTKTLQNTTYPITANYGDDEDMLIIGSTSGIPTGYGGPKLWVVGDQRVTGYLYTSTVQTSDIDVSNSINLSVGMGVNTYYEGFKQGLSGSAGATNTSGNAIYSPSTILSGWAHNTTTAAGENSEWRTTYVPVQGSVTSGRLEMSWGRGIIGIGLVHSNKFIFHSDSRLTLGAFTLPGTDGTNGQVLTTNGSGVVSWQAGGGGLSLASIGSSPNANGMTLTGSVLNLQPANATNGGALSTLAQTIAGDKSFTGIMAVSSKVNVGSPSGTAGSVNAGQDGIYSYRNGDATRFMRFATFGTFNDFLSSGAKLVFNFGFAGVVQDASFFEGSAAHAGTLKIGNNATTTSRLNVKGSTTNSSAWAGRFYNSGDAELLGIRNDGTLNLFGGSTLIPPASPVAITLPATAGTLVTSATAVPYTGANANVELTTFNIGAGNATFRGQLRSYRAVYSRVHTLSSNTTITENHHTVFADANAAAFTVILLAANSSQIWDATEKVGVTYIIKKIDSSANAVTVQGIVDGVTNPTLTTQYQSIMIQNDGDANTWRILSKN